MCLEIIVGSDSQREVPNNAPESIELFFLDLTVIGYIYLLYVITVYYCCIYVIHLFMLYKLFT